MKLQILLTALLLSGLPALSASDMASERLKGYYHGYIYGVGNALCGLAIDELIKKEYANELLSGTVAAHRSRHTHATHAIRRGVDVFTLQATLGHSSSATTGNYVASNPRDSSSLRLG